MFRVISIIGFSVTIAAVAVHYIVCPTGKTRSRWKPAEIIRKPVRLLTLTLLEQHLSTAGILKKLLYLLALLCFVVLLITGFGPRLILDRDLTGYWLMAHATFAPVFALCIAALAVMTAYRCRFDKSDFSSLPGTTNKNSAADFSKTVTKACFWLICVLAAPLFLSILLSMFPFFGTDGQQFLFNLHRASALAFALVAIVHTYLLIRTRVRKR